MYLFSSNQQPGYHLLNEKYFCMRFRKYKDLHGFGRNHTMYGLKHTFISQMKRQGATDKELLNITGLVTIEALYKYLKDIGAVEPADMSDKYLVKF